MGVTDSPTSTDPNHAVDDKLAATIEAIEEGDPLVINGDSRTWDLTYVVDRPIEDPVDERVHKRVCRLNSKNADFGLELVEHPDCHEATLHVLETTDWAEADQTYAVDDFEVLDQQVPWVVVGNSTSTYHFPDPHAAAYGGAAPACGAGDEDTDYRITRISTVYPAYRGCKDCVRHTKPVELQPDCPECRKAICHGMLQEVELAAIDGLSTTYPRCEFDGVATVDMGVQPDILRLSGDAHDHNI